MKSRPLLFASALGSLALAFGVTAVAQQGAKVTYDDHVLPVFRNNCTKCHNPEKAKADLDLSTFSGALKGGSSGVVLKSGDPDGSKLVKVIMHAEEPEMPPKSKLPDKDIALIKSWVAGGLLENSGAKVIAMNRPKVDLSAAVGSTDKLDGPPPMPGDVLLEPIVRTERTGVATAIAASPWSPLIALGGQRQVLLFNTDTLELAGVFAFPEGHPADLKFSRNGKLLIAGGGRGSKSGFAVVWDVTTGDQILKVGDEPDTALAADISPNQHWIALGSPNKLVKIFSTKTGEQLFKMKKHTDWVTAVEFSPDNKYLATGDRSGGIVVWEADSGEEVHVLTGHRAQITSLMWRSGEVLMSASEDGSVRAWTMLEGQQARNSTAHNGGVLGAKLSRDGKLASCGRDNQASVWDAGGNRIISVTSTNDLPVRVALSHDASRFVIVDWTGRVSVCNAANGQRIGFLDLNPPSIADQLALAQKRLAELEETAAKSPELIAAAEAEVKKLQDSKAAAKAIEDATKKVADAKAAAEKAPKDVAAAKASVERLKLGQFFAQVYRARESFTSKKDERDRLLAESEAAKASVKKLNDELTAAKKEKTSTKEEKAALAAKLKRLNDSLKLANDKASSSKTAADKLAKSLPVEEAKFKKLAAEYQKLKASPSPSPTVKTAGL
jgi:mono/diheme cytochrome c family protein